MATRTRADDIEDLRVKILQSVRDLGAGDAEVNVGWLGESPDDSEVLVEVILPDPGEGRTWDQDLAKAIRTLVRELTAEYVPAAVATTRLVNADSDG